MNRGDWSDQNDQGRYGCEVTELWLNRKMPVIARPFFVSSVELQMLIIIGYIIPFIALLFVMLPWIGNAWSNEALLAYSFVPMYVDSSILALK